MAQRFAGPMGGTATGMPGMSVMDALGKLGINSGAMPSGMPDLMKMGNAKQLQQALSLGRSAVSLQKAMQPGATKTALTPDTYYKDPGKIASAVMAIWKQYNSDLADAGQPNVGLPQFISQMPFSPEVTTMFQVLFGGAGGEQIFDAGYYQQGQ